MTYAFTVVLPDIGEGVVEGEVIQWLKAVGDSVSQDEPVVVVMTDKATVELPAPKPGIISKHYYGIGKLAIKDKPLYEITVEGQAPVALQHQKETFIPQRKTIQKKTSCPKSSENTLATPIVRKLAKDLGIDLNSIQGTGPDGRVLKEDLKAPPSAYQSRKRAMPPISNSTPVEYLPGDTTESIFGVRNLILEKMVESKYIVPHFSFGDKFNATRLVQLRNNIKAQAAKENIKVTYMPFFIRAITKCLQEFPILNASVDIVEKRIVYHKSINIGIAVKTAQGTVIPVLQNSQDKSLEQIIRSFHDLMEKARADKLSPSDMKHSTFTISNFGAIGGMWGTPVINYPEVAILGIGKMEEQAIVSKGTIIIAPMVELSWSCDHRIIDGDVVAACSKLFIKMLEEPACLL